MLNHNARYGYDVYPAKIGDKALSVEEDEPTVNNRLPNYRPLSSIVCLMAAVGCVCCVDVNW